MSDKTTKKIVMIGGFGHEGLNANIKALGYGLVELKLEGVLPKTWLLRRDIIGALQASEQLAGCVIYLHSNLLLTASTEKYRDAFSQILKCTQNTKTIIFVYQDNLDGVFSLRHRETREPMTLEELEEALENGNFDEWSRYQMNLEDAVKRLRNYQGRPAEVNDFLQSLYESGAEVSPFFTRTDVTIRLQEFLNDIEGGVFLRLFVPRDRLHADQVKSLLGMLEHYLRQVEQRKFSVDSNQSEKGVVYVFRSDLRGENLQTLDEALSRFDQFLRICTDDSAQAESILKAEGLPQEEASFAVEKYAREYRRLILDSKHEIERKVLGLRQRLESEITEGHVVPTISWQPSGIQGLLATGANIAVNIGDVSIIDNRVHNEIDQLINGSVNYNDYDKLLIELFNRHAEPLEALQCRSDLDQLKDKSTPEPKRHNAKQRLIGFIMKAAHKGLDVTEKVAVATLSKYLESVLKGM